MIDDKILEELLKSDEYKKEIIKLLEFHKDTLFSISEKVNSLEIELNSLKDIKTEIDNLKNKIEDLNKTIIDLENRIKIIEKELSKEITEKRELEIKYRSLLERIRSLI